MKKKLLVPLLISAAFVVTLPITIGKKQTHVPTEAQIYRIELGKHKIYRASNLEGHDMLVHEFPREGPHNMVEFEYYVDTTGDGYANLRGHGRGDFSEERIIKEYHVGYKNFPLDSVQADMDSLYNKSDSNSTP